MPVCTICPSGILSGVETEPPQGYLRDEQVHEVHIDPTADPTQLIREVDVANTKNYPSAL